ncbi:MAG: D-alanyl-D-alanine carboxypeptidase/D-alanyl-D-alanine-endopeptidase [Gemmatimonadota bacterium]
MIRLQPGLVLALGAALTLQIPLEAQDTATSPNLFPLQNEIARLVGSPGWRGAEWGVLAISLERGDTLVALSSEARLAPASNQKLFTSAAALYHLGPEFRFPTYMLTDGTVRDGILDGNLILYGTGDPAISDRILSGPTEPFREFARALARLGIHTVTGDVIGDASFFEGPSRHPSWNARDLDDWYAAPVSALTFSENVVTLQVRGGEPGTTPQPATDPPGAGILVTNSATTVSGRPSSPVLLVRDGPEGAIELRGEVRSGAGELWRVLTVADPAAYAASVLRHVLAEEGIRMEGSARALGPEETSPVTRANVVAPAFDRGGAAPLRTLAVHYSPPVRELLQVMNKVSHNLYSELFLFAVGRITTGTGSFASGAQALTDYLINVVGVAPGDIYIEDGSGLSRFNRATASSFISLLTHVSETSYADDFWASLPEAGNRRELGRMYQSLAAGNLRAKTGTISRVSALSGVVRGVGGEPILFSILSNNVPSTSTAKSVEDRIGIELASFSRSWGPSEGELARVEYGDYGPRMNPVSEVSEALDASVDAARR